MKMLLGFVLILVLMPLAQAKVILLTSFSKMNEQKTVENSFRKNLKPKKGEIAIEIEVRHQATQWELYQALRNRSYEGVFWVSHGQSGSSATGSRLISKLLDYRGDDVAPVFALTPSNISFLAVIGCNSTAILAEANVHEVVRERSYVSKDVRANATKEIERAVKAFKALPPLDPRAVENVRAANFGTISVKRSVPINVNTALLRSVRVWVGEQLVGVMPTPFPGSIEEMVFNVAASNGLDIKIETGENAVEVSGLGVMGDFKVWSNDIRGDWEIFADDEGNPLGVNHRLFFHNP